MAPPPLLYQEGSCFNILSVDFSARYNRQPMRIFIGKFKHLRRSIVRAAIVLCLAAAGLAAQAPAQDRPGQYDRADIEAGSALYSAQCVACHGPNGDMINGIDLRRGLFRTAVSDED